MPAAIRPELFGPIIIAGSLLSYWAGVHGKNPMRYSGALLGGSWLTALTSDLGHVNLNAEEIQFIVDELFVANKLAAGEIKTSDGTAIDLRNIRSPIVVCSKGDNIIPQQIPRGRSGYQ